MGLTLRNVKGSPLTYTEMDNNLLYLESSSIVTASIDQNAITFTKGDGSIFLITVDTGSVSVVDTGSLLLTASISSNTITFTKGDGSTFFVTVDTGSTFPYTGSAEITGSLNTIGSTTSTLGFTGSLQGTASWADNTLTASYLNTLNQDLIFNGNLTLNGTASVTYLNVSYESASVIYSSGSNQFGDATNDTQTLIGNTIITGSLQVTGSANIPSITGSLFGTSSWAQNAITASYVQTAQTASYVLNAVSASYATTASYVLNAVSSSFATTASYAQTSSYAIFAETASFSERTVQTDVLVLNQTGFNIAKGTVVRITGSNNSSDIPRIVTASYENDNNSANTLGITTQIITNGNQGYVLTEGILKGIDTTNYVSGQLIYLGATGSITGSAPKAPLHTVRLGEIVREQSNNGSAYIRIDNGAEIGELHDVVDNTTTASFGDLLVKSGSVWTNSKQLTGSYGLTGSFQQGISVIAFGNYSHAEGDSTTALGTGAHAEGNTTITVGTYSHAEGYLTITSGSYSHAEGDTTTAIGNYSHAEGSLTTAIGNYSHAEGSSSIAIAGYSHAEGFRTTAKALMSHAEGTGAKAEGGGSHAEGFETRAISSYSHTEGYQTTVISVASYGHAEGWLTTVGGTRAHAEGYLTRAIGDQSHAEGYGTRASSEGSHAEGYLTTALGKYSHAEGSGSIALGVGSHAEGLDNTASGSYSHAEGNNTTASGYGSHTEGQGTIALGDYSHAEGEYTIASGSGQLVAGKFNTQNDNTSLFIIGSGTSTVARKDAFKVTPSSSIIMPTTQSAAPTWTGKDGEIVPATISGNHYLYMWMSGAWRSTEFVPQVIYEITGSLTAAQINALDGSPITILPAPGANKYYMIENCSMYYKGGTTAFTTTAGLSLYYSEWGNDFAEVLPASVLTSIGDSIRNTYLTNYTFQPSILSNIIVNDAIELWADGAISGGDGTIKYSITYRILNTP